jgi:cytoskeletal protein CcmA (bactofilin family)
MADAGETTVVGADSHFKGELSFERVAKIIGKFDGQINGKGELQVADNARCKADVKAGSVQVDGTIEGNLQAKETIRLNAKGTVRGDIVAAKMVMAEGASFYGQCAVGPEAEAGRSGGGQTGRQPGQGGPQGEPARK